MRIALELARPGRVPSWGVRAWVAHGTDDLQEYLAQAERHVQEGERDVARQLQVVDDLERDGLNTGEAMMLLLQFEELLAACIADRNRLLRQVGLRF